MAVSETEIESLHKLFRKLSDSVIKDGQIHKVSSSPFVFIFHLHLFCDSDFISFDYKEELQLALFKNVNERNLFLDRVCDVCPSLLISQESCRD